MRRAFLEDVPESYDNYGTGLKKNVPLPGVERGIVFLNLFKLIRLLFSG